jgi:hypothetical protein
MSSQGWQASPWIVLQLALHEAQPGTYRQAVFKCSDRQILQAPSSEDMYAHAFAYTPCCTIRSAVAKI